MQRTRILVTASSISITASRFTVTKPCFALRPALCLTRRLSYNRSPPTQLHLRSSAAVQHRTQRDSPKHQVRRCSCKRVMCRSSLLDAGESAGAGAVIDGREVLPKNVKPTHYNLHLWPNLDGNVIYVGQVTIDLDVLEDTTEIQLNGVDLKIKDSRIECAGKIESNLKESYNYDKQIHTFELQQSLQAGTTATLVIDFHGLLNDDMAGFYRSSYKSKDGQKRWMATTQMEPTDARRAFPCFDEPALKAKFTVTLIADKALTCLSNMDVKEIKDWEPERNENKKAVTFNTTPLMSTYLLAFIVGEFNYIETNQFRIPVRVYATPDQDIEHGRFSLDLAARTLEFYEKKFDSPFPLPKMDMIAIPDFSAGAMENWGLVTYRVVDLLINDQTSPVSTKIRVAEVVQHELAHQWFGNLVTMDFWEGLWLNEGFATWMSWYAVDSFFPEWKMWQGYITDSLQDALSLDSLRSSHPVEVPVKRADEVMQIFDAISYMKGSCVIRMISRYIGEETFLEGVRRYLKKHAYANTQTVDLWNALSDASGKDVAKVMGIWTKNVGYPVVTVTEDATNSSIHVKQNRFLRTADVKPEEDQTIFPVFLGLRTEDGVDEEIALMQREQTFNVPNLEFYKLNSDHTSLYRTLYTSDRLTKLGEAAKAGKLTVEDRAGMVADAGALSASGYQPTSGTLRLLSGLSNETEFTVWEVITSFIGSLRAAFLFQDEAVKDALKSFLRELTAPKAHALGWSFSKDEDSVQQQMKALLFGAAGGSGDEKVIAAAREMFAKRIAGDESAIHPNIRGAVFAIILQYPKNDSSPNTDYDSILDIYHKAPTADERNTALRTLGRSRDPSNIQRTLALALKEDEVRSQDIYMPLGGLRSHAEGTAALWQWLVSDWDGITKRLPQTGHMLGSVVQICTGSLSTQAQEDEVHAFFDARSTKGFDRGLAQSLDAVSAKRSWVARSDKDVRAWLKEQKFL